MTTSGTGLSLQSAGRAGAGGTDPAPRTVSRYQLGARAREARRQEREAARRGWSDVAGLYGRLADALEALGAPGDGTGNR